MNALTTAVFVCAMLALLFFPAFALLGITFGLVLVARGKVNHGLMLVLVAATSGYCGVLLDLPYGEIVWRDTAGLAQVLLQV
jgi:hypothetical protein